MKSAVENSTESDNDENDGELLGEDYRWEWSNPELANVQEGPKPSEIKAAILQDITPELQAKIDQAREEYRRGETLHFESKEEMHAWLDAL